MQTMESDISQNLVMPGLVPGIHVLAALKEEKDVDGRDKPGHDEKDPHGEERGFFGLQFLGLTVATMRSASMRQSGLRANAGVPFSPNKP
jgi:hypothetical protein